MRMTASWFRSHVDRPNTRVWRDDPRPMASSPLIVDARLLPSNLSSSLRTGSDDGTRAATGIFGRRDQANRATVPPAHIAMLTRLDAKTRPARSETMAVVRSSQVESHLGRNRLTSKAPYKACSGFTHVTEWRIAQPPKAAFVTRLQPSQLPGQAARQLPDQSTTLWVEPSSTGDTRRRGALGNAGLNPGEPDFAFWNSDLSVRVYPCETAAGVALPPNMRIAMPL